MTQLLYRKTMRTSSRISLQFTLWIAIISGILLGIINTTFMYGWIKSETQNITQYVVLKNLQPRNPYTDTLQRQERVMAFPDIAFKPEDLPTFWGIKRFRLFDDRRWIVGKSSNYYVLFDVSQNINRQLGLLSISGVSWITVVVLSFIFGRIFVVRSLRDLRTLSKRVGKRDITKANGNLSFEHLPEHDEINSIARSIENLENRIQGHYTNLRQFVGNVSHELKTPLMVMSSELDLTERTKAYEGLIPTLKGSVNEMHAMISALLTLTRLQSQDTIDKTDIKIYDVVEDVISNLQKKYQAKQMYTHINDTSKKESHQANENLIKILITNIIDNARKYSPEKTKISVLITKDSIQVENTGSISQDIIDNMRTPFWQADKNRGDGVGIGLSLVQEIIRLHDWQITYTSTDNKVICTIYFANVA